MLYQICIGTGMSLAAESARFMASGESVIGVAILGVLMHPRFTVVKHVKTLLCNV